jgi:hypothetical protein
MTYPLAVLQHTPGPWFIPEQDALAGIVVRSAFGRRGQGSTIARIPLNQYDLGNARLIAAAPDLLAALNGLFEHCAMVHKHWGEGSNTREADAAIAFARTAIEKTRV